MSRRSMPERSWIGGPLHTLMDLAIPGFTEILITIKQNPNGSQTSAPYHTALKAPKDLTHALRKPSKMIAEPGACMAYLAALSMVRSHSGSEAGEGVWGTAQSGPQKAS